VSPEPQEDLLLVRPPRSSEEYQRACAFASERYRAAGYLTTDAPFDHPRALLVATRGSQLVGSVGVESADDALLPTERAFGFRCENIGGARRSRTFECTRLAVARSAPLTVLKALIAACMVYARERQAGPLWLLTVTPQLDRLMRHHCYLHIDRLPFPLADDTLRRDYPAYWATDPPPYPTYVTSGSSDAALDRLLPELSAGVRFELARFDHHHDQGRRAAEWAGAE
jgi:hypothetical protein